MHSTWDVAKEKDHYIPLYPLKEGLSHSVEDGFPVEIGRTGCGGKTGRKINRGATQEMLSGQPCRQGWAMGEGSD